MKFILTVTCALLTTVVGSNFAMVRDKYDLTEGMTPEQEEAFWTRGVGHDKSEFPKKVLEPGTYTLSRGDFFVVEITKAGETWIFTNADDADDFFEISASGKYKHEGREKTYKVTQIVPD